MYLDPSEIVENCPHRKISYFIKNDMINFESVNKEVFQCHLNVYTIRIHVFLYLSLLIKVVIDKNNSEKTFFLQVIILDINSLSFIVTWLIIYKGVLYLFFEIPMKYVFFIKYQ